LVATEAARTQGVSATQTDEDLVSRIQRADAAAYADLCDRFGPPLHGFAASRLAGDQELARDVMVQTLVDAVRNIRRFNPRKASLSAWLYGIARRQIGLAARRRTRRKSIPSSAQVPIDSLPELSSGDDMAADIAARIDAQQKVAHLARFLSDVEMEVLVLHSVDGLSMKDIGRSLRRSEAAVESLLYRARQKARERLAGHAE
jgi:RNA polymerase sigma-70 factor (ECF subfamily)